SRRRHTRLVSDWSSDVCSSDLCSLVSATPFLRSCIANVCFCAPAAPSLWNLLTASPPDLNWLKNFFRSSEPSILNFATRERTSALVVIVPSSWRRQPPWGVHSTSLEPSLFENPLRNERPLVA